MGSGKELAVQMADQGAKIVLTSRNIEKLNAVKESLKGSGHVVYPLDLLQTALIPEAAEEVLKETGGIDILVNNAGLSQRSLTKDTSVAVDRKIMELDHFAVVILTKSLLPHMLERQSGLIVTISSVAGKVGVPMRSAYCAAKHAVIGFMGSLRAEVHHDNIKVLVVTPGSTQTNISKNALEGDGKPHGITDPAIANGVPVSVCVRKIIDGIRAGKSELLIANSRETFMSYLARFFPGYLRKLLTRIAVT